LATFCIRCSAGIRNKLGWFHEVVRGTIHSAALFGEVEVLQKHIEKIKDVDVFDESGMAAIHWACLSGKLQCVQLLLAAGSNVDILNNGLNSPLLIASAFGHRDIIFCLLDHIPTPDVRLRNLKDYDCLQMFLLYGATEANARDIIDAFKVKGVDIYQANATGLLRVCSARGLPPWNSITSRIRIIIIHRYGGRLYEGI
jgi:ankyrin repeat protein